MMRKIMNDKDKKAFEKWWENDCYEYDSDQLITQKDALYIWEKTCEYKQKEIDDLVAENARLRECVEFYASTGALNDEHDFFILKDYKFSIPTTRRARQILKELEDK